MKILWLGQGGLLLVSGKTKLIIDPYLSNTLAEFGRKFARKMKINKKIFKVKPNAIIITNSHSDHADINTIEKFAHFRNKSNPLTVLSCGNVFEQLINIPSLSNANHVMLESGSEWTIEDINIRAVTAKTDDKTAFGIVITDTLTDKKYYVAGDTLYNRQTLSELPRDIYATFLPINGLFGCMNVIDAKRLALDIGAKFVIPIHFGMFDKVDPASLSLDNAVIPKIYKIIDFEKAESVSIKKELDSKFNEKLPKIGEIKNEQDEEFEVEIKFFVDNDSEPVPASLIHENQEMKVTPSLENEIIEQAKSINLDETFTSEIEVIKASDSEEIECADDYDVFEISEDAENDEEIEKIEDTETVGNAEETAENIETIEDIEEATEDIEVFEDIEAFEDIEEVTEDIETAENIENMENVENIDDFEDELNFDSFDNGNNSLDEGDDLDEIINIDDDFFDDDEYKIIDSDNALQDEQIDEAESDGYFDDESASSIAFYASSPASKDNGESEEELIDAYIREIEKFERGETSDFTRPKGIIEDNEQ